MPANAVPCDDGSVPPSRQSTEDATMMADMQKMFERVNTAMENPEWASVMQYDDVTRWLLSEWGVTVA